MMGRAGRAGVCIMMMASAALAEDRVKPLERIGVKPGIERAEFVLKKSGKPFFVKGFNYIRLRSADGKPGGDHATDDWDLFYEKMGDFEPGGE